MEQEPASNRKWGIWLAGAALGAVAMYFSDPDRGKRRRAVARDKMRSLQTKTGSAVDVVVRDLSNRLEGIQAQLSRALFRRNGIPNDQVVAARVRAKLGRVVSHPHAIKVTVHRGHLILIGPILAHEMDKLLDIVLTVPGVIDVEDKLEVHERPDRISSLQGGSERAEIRPEFMQENWTPALRGIAILGGGVLGCYGLLARRAPAGAVLTAAGVALLMRGATNTPMKRLVGIGMEERMVDLQKTIEIQAPPETVFDVWANYENFPHFMSHVQEVRDLGEQRSHWVVKGLGGVRLAWDAVLTESTRPTALAWKSEPGAAVEHVGSIRFEPTVSGTRVTVRMSYRLPAGALGHGLAMLLGNEPKRELGEDLIRMKNFIERGISPHDAAKPVPAPSQLLH